MTSENENRLAAEMAEAARALAVAECLEVTVDLWHQAQSFHRRVQTVHLPKEIWVQEATLRLRIERALGSQLREARLAQGSPGNQYTGKVDRYQQPPVRFFLSDLKISKKVSSRAQRIATIPNEVSTATLPSASGRSGRHRTTRRCNSPGRIALAAKAGTGKVRTRKRPGRASRD